MNFSNTTSTIVAGKIGTLYYYVRYVTYIKFNRNEPLSICPFYMSAVEPQSHLHVHSFPPSQSRLDYIEATTYCKFGNIRENFIFAKSVERHICDVKNSRLRHDLVPISVNDRMI